MCLFLCVDLCCCSCVYIYPSVCIIYMSVCFPVFVSVCVCIAYELWRPGFHILIFKIIYHFLFMGVSPICKSVYVRYLCTPLREEESIESLWISVTDGGEPPCGYCTPKWNLWKCTQCSWRLRHLPTHLCLTFRDKVCDGTGRSLI